MKNILDIEYLSSDVKYEIVGKDRLITHLNEILANKNVHAAGILCCGSLQSIPNIVNVVSVIKNIRKKALNK